MELDQSDKIRELKLTAKWAVDNNEKKKAISELVHHGDEALPAIKEVFNVTAFEEIRAACIEAIGAMGREQKKHGKPHVIRKSTRRSKTTSNHKGKKKARS
jgi:hypothetical protein